MKEIKIKYANGNELTWKAWEYTIQDEKLIYSSYNDNSINIIKLAEICTIEVDNEVVYDKYMDSFKKQVDAYLKSMHHDRIVDMDIWKCDCIYIANIVEISENHMIYRYSYHANSNDEEFKLKYDNSEVF